MEKKTHYVLMHDLSDQRYSSPRSLRYDGKPLWSGDSHSEARMIIGHVNSAVAQAVSILDFCTRNGIHLESADHTFHEEFDPETKVPEMSALLGEQLFSMRGHWFFFSLNSADGPFTYPGKPGSTGPTSWR